MPDKEEKREAEIEYPEIQEVEHKTPHPKPDMTREITESFAPGENHYLNPNQSLED